MLAKIFFHSNYTIFSFWFVWNKIYKLEKQNFINKFTKQHWNSFCWKRVIRIGISKSLQHVHNPNIVTPFVPEQTFLPSVSTKIMCQFFKYIDYASKGTLLNWRDSTIQLELIGEQQIIETMFPIDSKLSLANANLRALPQNPPIFDNILPQSNPQHPLKPPHPFPLRFPKNFHEILFIDFDVNIWKF